MNKSHILWLNTKRQLMSMERENHLQRKIHESDFKCTVCMCKIYIKWINKDLLNSTGNSTQYSTL